MALIVFATVLARSLRLSALCLCSVRRSNEAAFGCDHSITTCSAAVFAVGMGLLLVAAGPSVLRMVPPLTINKREIRELLRRLAATLSSFS